jgi:hypothetical protein
LVVGCFGAGLDDKPPPALQLALQTPTDRIRNHECLTAALIVKGNTWTSPPIWRNAHLDGEGLVRVLRRKALAEICWTLQNKWPRGWRQGDRAAWGLGRQHDLSLWHRHLQCAAPARSHEDPGQTRTPPRSGPGHRHSMLHADAAGLHNTEFSCERAPTPTQRHGGTKCLHAVHSHCSRGPSGGAAKRLHPSTAGPARQLQLVVRQHLSPSEHSGRFRGSRDELEGQRLHVALRSDGGLDLR